MAELTRSRDLLPHLRVERGVHESGSTIYARLDVATPPEVAMAVAGGVLMTPPDMSTKVEDYLSARGALGFNTPTA